MAESHIQTLTAISLVIILSISFASALDFTLSSPDKVEMNKSFSVSLSASVSDICDVKIFAQDNNTKTTISEIYNDGWKNPFYYIKSVFPSKSEFEIRVIADSSNAVLCARLRKTNSSTYSEKCKSIVISENEKEDADTDEDDKIQAENDSISSKNTSSKQTGEDFTALPDNSPPQLSLPVPDNERITLNQAETIKKEYVFMTKSEKIKLFMLYGFTTLSVFIIILLALKRL